MTTAPRRCAPTPPRPVSHRPLLGLALFAVAANLRTAMASVPPLRDVDRGRPRPVQRRPGRPDHAAGPVHGAVRAVRAADGPPPGAARRRPARRLIRASPASGSGSGGGAAWALYAGTFLAGVGIAIGGTLLPGLVKELFPPERAGLVTGLYMLAMMGGAGASSALSVPLAGRLGPGRPRWGRGPCSPLVGVLAWVPVTDRRRPGTVPPNPRRGPGRPALAARHRLAGGRRTWRCSRRVLLVPGVGRAVVPGPRLGRDHHADTCCRCSAGPRASPGCSAPASPTGSATGGCSCCRRRCSGAAGLLGLAVAPEAAPLGLGGPAGHGPGPGLLPRDGAAGRLRGHARGQRATGRDGVFRQLPDRGVGADGHGRGP